jgi:hypothetical protein
MFIIHFESHRFDFVIEKFNQLTLTENLPDA